MIPYEFSLGSRGFIWGRICMNFMIDFGYELFRFFSFFSGAGSTICFL
jgi:hypothetical protein